mmetsp:Transcript_30703/g.22781  ORF Transcript_30703/g.22781 Transcript_30703/m.22781 type:complete len:157 (+) Transcript_30703:59-529(+)
MLDLYPDFKVDNFFANRKDQYTFFLTHNHEDHLQGLSKESSFSSFSVPDESWAWGTIYTSDLSAKLLLARFPHLKPYVKVLPLQQKTKIRGRIVTLLEANHCPGAIMLLFEGPRGTVLHTGDFRYRREMLDHLKDKQIDTLHLDNTFAMTDEDFPT